MSNLHREGDPLPGAEDEESRPLGVKGQPLRRPRQGRGRGHCPEPKVINQDHRPARGCKAKDGDPLAGAEDE